jgi:prevent-host-death family protein
LRWKIAEAKQNLSELLRRASVDGPQLICKRSEVVALVADVRHLQSPEVVDELGVALVDASTYRDFQAWQSSRETSIFEATAPIRELAAIYDWELEVPERRDRPNAFVEMLESEAPDQ